MGQLFAFKWLSVYITTAVTSFNTKEFDRCSVYCETAVVVSIRKIIIGRGN